MTSSCTTSPSVGYATVTTATRLQHDCDRATSVLRIRVARKSHGRSRVAVVSAALVPSRPSKLLYRTTASYVHGLDPIRQYGCRWLLLGLCGWLNDRFLQYAELWFMCCQVTGYPAAEFTSLRRPADRSMNVLSVVRLFIFIIIIIKSYTEYKRHHVALFCRQRAYRSKTH